MGGGTFYVQTGGDQKIASIQQQLAALNLKDAPVIGAFNPKRGDIVFCYFHADKSWYWAMVVNSPRGPVESPTDILAYIKIPNLEEDFGQEAAEYLSELTLNSGKEFRAKVEEKDTSGGKVKGQGTGTILVVILVVVDAEINVNAAMLQEGLARTEKRNRWDRKERQSGIDNLENFQEEAKSRRRGMWQYKDIQCPGRDEPYSDEAIALMRRKIMQRDVDIEVEIVDRTGTFLGSLWESRINVAATLLEQAEQYAKRQETGGDQKIASIQQQLAALNLKDAPVIGAFNPKRGDIVFCYFHADKSCSQLRPVDPFVSVAPGLAQLCSLAYIKIPNLEEDFGQEAAEYLSELTLNSGKEFRAKVEEKDTSGGKVKGQGTGTILVVILVVVDAEINVNAAMLQEGLARTEKRNRWDRKERQSGIDNLENFQEEAKSRRRGMWQYKDIQSDD
ncbi:hypothetical protein DEO72_LG4g177 [Vigna unguiculata]|uniref:TNase-like domain-containing protein n=1 Tax=Vigna unguiculata TaxID=3917 RepID=A0A4D6LLP9_VIGUN|nr:hypothetical protein DEO72_LG4g177 [Vigna unguiculata]